MVDEVRGGRRKRWEQKRRGRKETCPGLRKLVQGERERGKGGSSHLFWRGRERELGASVPSFQRLT